MKNIESRLQKKTKDVPATSLISRNTESHLQNHSSQDILGEAFDDTLLMGIIIDNQCSGRNLKIGTVGCPDRRISAPISAH